jgi:hypothetical protein
MEDLSAAVSNSIENKTLNSATNLDETWGFQNGVSSW